MSKKPQQDNPDLRAVESGLDSGEDLEKARVKAAEAIATIVQQKLDMCRNFVQKISYGSGEQLDLGNGLVISKGHHGDGYGYHIDRGDVYYGTTFYDEDERPPRLRRSSGNHAEGKSESGYIGPPTILGDVESKHIAAGQIEDLIAEVAAAKPSERAEALRACADTIHDTVRAKFDEYKEYVEPSPVSFRSGRAEPVLKRSTPGAQMLCCKNGITLRLHREPRDVWWASIQKEDLAYSALEDAGMALARGAVSRSERLEQQNLNQEEFDHLVAEVLAAEPFKLK